MQNIEIKLELRDPELARAILAAIGAKHIGDFRQTDTYYKVAAGRLKKRETEGHPPEWIHYERSDDARPRPSRFTIYSEEAAAAHFGPGPFPVRTVVHKTRELYLDGQTRVHLDDVEGLGRFLEIEALITRDSPAEKARAAVTSLLDSLRPALGEPIAVGYADMLEG